MSPAPASKMFRNVAKRWVVVIHCSNDTPYSAELRAARNWCNHNTNTLEHAQHNRLVFLDEADALLYYMAHAV